MEHKLNSHGKWWNKTKQWLQKQYFNVTHNIDLNVNDENQNQINIFGHQFSENHEARILYSSILWFTYRENLQFDCSDITSDVGWGCMLRVGQMAIAQALRRTGGIQKYGDKQNIQKILGSITQTKSLFSVENMTQKGKQIFNKGPGSWFTPAQTAIIIKQLQNSQQSSQLRVLVYHNQFETLSALQTLRDTNYNKSNEITQNFVKRNKQTIEKSTKISIFPGLIIILARIGINSPQPEMLKTIIQIMKFPSFMGILGGKTSLAHYIVGFTNKNFIYLDPHYVKQNTGNIEDYFGSSIFSMPHEKVDTSMGFCFFVKHYGEFIRLCDDLLTLNNKVFYTHCLIGRNQIMEITSCEKFELLKQ